jgi:hypothetical protein
MALNLAVKEGSAVYIEVPQGISLKERKTPNTKTRNTGNENAKHENARHPITWRARADKATSPQKRWSTSPRR